MSAGEPKRQRWVAWLLVLLPLWLLVSGAAGVWYFLKREKQAEIAGQQRFARTVSESALADDMRKIVDYIGERHASSETAARNLTRAAVMIEGLLGPSNTGYQVRRVRGPGDWPLLHVTVAGANPKASGIWVATSYDSRPGSAGVEANATGLAATLAAAQALAGDQPAVPVHFVFVPHANDPDAPVLETVSALRGLLIESGAPRAVMCVEAMGGGAELWLTSRDAAAIPLEHVRGLGSIRGAEVACLGEDADLASMLFETGLPAVRVATRPVVLATESDDRPPAPAVLAAASGRLIELIRRCAAAP